ncbi:MAG: 4-alpha-glucanotransferase [Planctomycetaceae bacterium]|nr:4-alpha-glucanotransferase [Planctomycetaceae bacterium]
MHKLEFPERTSGILLHPTSLPGPHGIGSLGRSSYSFVDFLVAAQQSVWQILPLSPPGFGNSPYSAFCSVAGNPLLISLSQLMRAGDLAAADTSGMPSSDPCRVDFPQLVPWKMARLENAARTFLASANSSRRHRFEEFCQCHAEWLDDYALFMAIKEVFDQRAAAAGYWGSSWNRYWDKDIALREPQALERWKQQVADRAVLYRVWQYYFFEQWTALREYANERGILIVGDMPIFVALDSADVWVSPHLFTLDEQCQERLVAGVPPDYFSPTGQRWGNPLYNWDAMQADGFAWWVRRFRTLLELVDIVRIDHFRGFAACWAIPAEECTAVHGQWMPVPGAALFHTLAHQFGRLPFLAEDLGLITPDVEQLRDQFGFPGMKVLQVALEDIQPQNSHLPEHHVYNSVVYPGTHDNNTAVGWYAALSGAKLAAIASYLGSPLQDPAWDMMGICMASRARAAVIPMQDVLRLGSEARMNIPATSSGNWRWRLPSDYVTPGLTDALAELTTTHHRAPGSGTAPRLKEEGRAPL